MAPPEAADEVALGFIHITMAAQRVVVRFGDQHALARVRFAGESGAQQCPGVGKRRPKACCTHGEKRGLGTPAAAELHLLDKPPRLIDPIGVGHEAWAKEQ